MTKTLSHTDDQGAANMVDVSLKQATVREATAVCAVHLQPHAFALLQDNALQKGDVLAVARVAGIQAAKKCADLIPLCHPLMLTKVQVDFDMDAAHSRVNISCTCKLQGKTGVEMEALTGASIAACTIFDMCKAVDKTITIEGLRVISKTGGKSGDWQAQR